MEQEYDYKEPSIGGGGDATNDHSRNNGIGQYTYLSTDMPHFNQSHAAKEGKKFYSENLRKYEDAVKSDAGYKPTNDNYGDVTFRTRNSNDFHSPDNVTSKKSASPTFPPSDDHVVTNNNPVESTTSKGNCQKQEQKRTLHFCKPETPTKKKTVFFDPKRIFADINKTNSSTDIYDLSDSQSEDESIDLREQTLRFDAEMKRKLDRESTSPSPERYQETNRNKSDVKATTHAAYERHFKERNYDCDYDQSTSSKAFVQEQESDVLDQEPTFPSCDQSGKSEPAKSEPNARSERHFKERNYDFDYDQNTSPKAFAQEQESDVLDQEPPLPSCDPSGKSEPAKSKPNARGEGYSKRKRKPRNNQQQRMPDNASRSTRTGRSTGATNSGRNQEAYQASQMYMDDESRDVDVEEDVREEAADGSGDALQQLFFGIIRTLAWFLGFLFFIFLVLLSFALNIAKRWFIYTVVFLNATLNWIRVKYGIPRRDRRNESGPSMEELQRLFNLGPSENILLPTEGEKAVERLLKCNSEDPYEVLGVTSDATDDDIKKYYRKQCIMVHPDKNTMTGAEEAFKVLGSAFEIVGEPTKRAEFHRAITEYAQKEMFHKEFAEQFKKMKEAFEERENTIHCSVCGRNHLRFLTDRPAYAARYCSKHDTRHPASHGDIWAESSHFGFRWHFFTCTGHKVYDVTEWAKCQNLEQMQSNAHEVRYKFDTKHRQNRQRPAPPPNFNADDFLEELLRQAQQAQNMDRGTRNQNTNANHRKHKKKHKKKKGF